MNFLKRLFGRSESKTGTETANTNTSNDFKIKVAVDENATSPFKLADGGNAEWQDARTTTPEYTERLPAWSPEEEEERYRSSLEGVSEQAAERLTFLVENHNFRGMPTSRVRTNWGIEWLGNGSFRNVYGFYEDSNVPLDNPEDYVMKVPGHHEEWTNEEEVKAYSRLQDTPVADYLAPIIDFGEGYEWLLMERVNTDEEPCRDTVREMKYDCEALGWKYHDWKPDNCGFTEDGDPILVDYGYHNKVSAKLK